MRIMRRTKEELHDKPVLTPLERHQREKLRRSELKQFAAAEKTREYDEGKKR
jgi:hypothetical protein